MRLINILQNITRDDETIFLRKIFLEGEEKGGHMDYDINYGFEKEELLPNVRVEVLCLITFLTLAVFFLLASCWPFGIYSLLASIIFLADWLEVDYKLENLKVRKLAF